MQRNPPPTTTLLGVPLSAPGVDGLLRTLAFLLALVLTLTLVDFQTGDLWASEAAVGLTVGAFCGCLLSECGVSLARHGWRAFALLLMCSALLLMAGSLVMA